MNTVLRKLEVILNDDGSVRASRGEYENVDDAGRVTLCGTRRLAAGDIEALFPSQAAALAALDAEAAKTADLTEQLAEVTSELDLARQELADLREAVVAAQARPS